jgi:ATP-dependent RNA helicase DeaD
MTISSFSDLDISQPILRALADMGFEEPTPIQKQAIPLLMTGQDIAGQAQTGTGKTAAYAIPGIEGCKEELKAVQVLVLCPTRELCVQIAAEYSNLLK